MAWVMRASRSLVFRGIGLVGYRGSELENMEPEWLAKVWK